MNTKTLLYSGIVGLAASSVSASSSCQSIAEIACGLDNFSTLCAAVKAAGLDGALAENTFTVFAPTDEAFGNLPEGTVAALLDDIPTLTDILLFHTVADHEVYARELHCQDTIYMTQGDESRTVCHRNGKIFQKGAGNPRSAMPEIVPTDIEACNGVIHVVSEVMLPPPMPMMDDHDDMETGDCMSVAEIACGDDRFETLCAAVVAAELDGVLATETVTVFAPTDAAFGMLPEGTVPALLNDIPALANILLFHVVLGHEVYSTDLECQDLVGMANHKDSRTVCHRNGKIFQKGASNEREAMPEIVLPDIKACNGVIHVVSQVMLP